MRILLIVHGFPPASQGGAEIYAHAQATALTRGGDEVCVLTRENNPGRPEFGLRQERRDGLCIAWINNTFARTRSMADTYRDERIEAAAARVIDDFRPDVAHAHHLTCLSTTIVDALYVRGIPVFYTLHDYWLMCHRGQLLDLELRVCCGPGTGGCGRCLDPAAGASAAAYSARRALAPVLRRLPAPMLDRLRAVVQGARTPVRAADNARAASAARARHVREVATRITGFIAPSRAIRDRFVEFGLDPARIDLSEYGCELPGGRPPTQREPARGQPPLRLGFLGSVMVSKAPHLLIEACAALPQGAVTVELFGEPVDYHGDRRYRDVMAPLRQLPWVRFRGRIDRGGVAPALAGIDVLVVPSIWPENSPLVIREAFLAGVPVVASRIGGIPETVTDGINGLLFAPGDTPDLVRVLRRLLDEPDLLPRLRAGIPAVRTVAEDVTATRGRYSAAMRQRQARTRLAAVILNYRTPEETLLAARALLRSRRPVDDLIVVDNDNADSAECRDALRPVADRLKLLQTGRNLGFSGGMNVGIRHALARGAARILLVNSDVVTPPEAIGALERTLDARPGAGIAGPVVLARHTPDRVASLGMSYHRGTGRMRHRGVGAAWPDVDLPTASAVDGVAGCFMLVSQSVFETIGLLDEDFFFGFEDLDFCLRAADAGIETIVAGAAAVFHEGSRSIGAHAPARLYYGARNQLLMAQRHARRHGPLASIGRVAWITALNVAHATRPDGASWWARHAAVARGVRDYIRGRSGPEA